MSEEFEKLKEFYKGIHECTLQIGSFVEDRKLEEIGNLLNIREKLINEVNQMQSGIELLGEQKTEINSMVENIKILENQNIEQMENQKEIIKKQLSEISINTKAIAAYKYKMENDPRLIDSKE
jgi:mevalonate kinase